MEPAALQPLVTPNHSNTLFWSECASDRRRKRPDGLLDRDPDGAVALPQMATADSIPPAQVSEQSRMYGCGCAFARAVFGHDTGLASAIALEHDHLTRDSKHRQHDFLRG